MNNIKFAKFSLNVWFLILLLFGITILPLLVGTYVTHIFSAFVVLLIFITFLLLSENKKFFYGLGSVVIVGEIADMFFHQNIIVHIFVRVLLNIYIFCVVIFFLKQLMSKTEITPSMIIESINGYLMTGIAFHGIVRLIFDLIPNSYAMTSSNGFQKIDSFYYTFTTMTTLGYGDILPVAPLAKSLSFVIAITGQFYVAVVVAMIIGKLLNQR